MSLRLLRRTVWCAGALLFALPLVAAPALPGWVAAVQRSIPSVGANDAAVVLLDEARLTIRPDGTRRIVSRMAWRLNGSSAFKLAVARVHYTTETREKPRLSAWLVRPDGSVKMYGRRDLIDALANPRALASSARVLTIDAAADAQAGAVFAWESEEEELSTYLQYSWSFRELHAVARSSVSVEVPAGWTVRGTVFNHESVPERREGNRVEWTLRDLPAITPEPLGPGTKGLMPWIGIDLVPPVGAKVLSRPPPANWAALSVELSPIYAARSAVTPPIAERARRVAGETASVLERIERLGRAVQELNYNIIALDLNRGGGITPRPAAETLAAGYGDCKDKAALLCSLLRAEGITAYPLATHAQDRKRALAGWPSISMFNHCIAAIAVDETVQAPAVLTHPQLGRLLVFDPTDRFTALGSLSRPHQGALGLLLAGEAGGLVRLPFESPADNRVDRTVDVTVRGDGAVEARINERYVGAAAARERARWHREGAVAFEKTLRERFSLTLGAVKTTPLEVNDEERSALELKIVVGALGYAKPMRDQLLILKPVLVGRRSASRVSEKARTQPIYLEPEALAETTTLAVPAGFTIAELPKPVELATDWAEYRTTCAAEGDTIRFRRELVIRAAELPPEQAAEVRRFFFAIVEAEQAPIVLERRQG